MVILSAKAINQFYYKQKEIFLISLFPDFKERIRKNSQNKIERLKQLRLTIAVIVNIPN